MPATATATTSSTITENRGLVVRAFAALGSPGRVDVSGIYAEDLEFVGPARDLWAGPASTGLDVLADPCLEIERLEVELDRVVTHVTLRSATGVEARGLFVHSIADGRITRVSSLVRWS